MERYRAGGEVARERTRNSLADPERVREGRARARPRGAARAADLRGRRRRAYRRGDGWADRRDGARHAAARLPRDRPAAGADRARGGRRAGALLLPVVALRQAERALAQLGVTTMLR